MLSGDIYVDRRYLKANVKQAKNHCEREEFERIWGEDILIEQSDYFSITLSRSM